MHALVFSCLPLCFRTLLGPQRKEQPSVPLRQSERAHARTRALPAAGGRAGWPREPRHAVVSLPGARTAPPLPLPPVRLAAARVQGRQGAARFSLELALRWPPCHVSAERDRFGLCLVRRGGDCDRPGAPSRFNAAASRKAEPRPVAEQRRVTEPPRALLSRVCPGSGVPVVLAPPGPLGSGRGCSSSYRDRWLDLKWLSAAADFSSKAFTANFDGSRGGVGAAVDGDMHRQHAGAPSTVLRCEHWSGAWEVR
jgi:hypothetical protein